MVMKGHQRIRQRFGDIVAASRQSSIRSSGRLDKNSTAAVSLELGDCERQFYRARRRLERLRCRHGCGMEQ
jgi:hypothetical protein